MSEAEKNNQSTASVGGLIVLAVIGFFVYQHFHPKWRGLYEVTNSNAIYASQEFGTYEECSAWAASSQAPGRINFECGTRCKAPTRPIQPWECDETRAPEL
ncbi:MAG: hypothetical protein JWN01_168 [Patescibacteria group bacterium]|nr:hypothetical protein [Patescibacteria group bacterium]